MWADWLGVPRLTLFAVLGAVIERGEDHRRAFEVVRPDIDLPAEIERKAAAGAEYRLEADDAYPDAVPCLRTLREAGYRIAVAANQPVSTEAMVTGLGIELELVVSSDRWGIAKPDPRFFERLAWELGLAPAAIAYVGDRADNDVRPAAHAGMVAIHLVRGPWGFAHAAVARAAGASAQIRSLDELPAALSDLGQPARRRRGLPA